MPLFQISTATSRDFPETQTGITGDHIIPGADPPEGDHLIHGDPAHIEHRHHLVTRARSIASAGDITVGCVSSKLRPNNIVSTSLMFLQFRVSICCPSALTIRDQGWTGCGNSASETSPSSKCDRNIHSMTPCPIRDFKTWEIHICLYYKRNQKLQTKKNKELYSKKNLLFTSSICILRRINVQNS